MQIGGLQKTTLIDFPGRVAATIFLVGCNLRCPFCYSPELVLPEKIKKHLYPVKSRKAGSPEAKFNGARISEKFLFNFLKERRRLLEGVCITGGEPTIHKDLPIFIKKIRKLGYLVKLDTNGSNPEMLKKLIDAKLVDYVAMDIKASKEKYNEATGVKVNIQDVQKSIDILKEGKVDYEFRSTIVPTIHKKEDVIEMAKWIRGAKKYYLQNFRPEKTIDPKFEKIKPYPQEYLTEIQKAISPLFEICQLR